MDVSWPGTQGEGQLGLFLWFLMNILKAMNIIKAVEKSGSLSPNHRAGDL